MKEKKAKVLNLYEHCQNDGFFLSDHAEHIVWKNDTEPVEYTVQTHIDNLVAFYGPGILEYIEEIVAWKKGRRSA